MAKRGLPTKTSDKIKLEDERKKKEIDTLNEELVAKEFRESIKEVLDKELNELSEKLHNLEKGKEFSIMELKSMLTRRKSLGIQQKYSPTELSILFDYYKKFIEKINKTQSFLPTKKNFCGFIGITSNVYSRWLQSDDKALSNIMQMIDDYITDIALTSAQAGEVREITTMFRMKAEHGIVEATAPVVIEHRNGTDLETIKRNIELLNQGKSLRTIELKKDKNGIYSEEEEK